MPAMNADEDLNLTQLSATQTAEAWIAQLQQRQKAGDANKQLRFNVVAAWVVGAVVLALSLPKVATVGVVIVGLIGLQVIFSWFGRRSNGDPQRYTFALDLIQAVAPELAPGAELRWTLDAASLGGAGGKPWLSGRFALKDGRQVGLQVVIVPRALAEFNERMIVSLDLPAPPSPAALETAAAALCEGEARLVWLEANGPRVQAIFAATRLRGEKQDRLTQLLGALPAPPATSPADPPAEGRFRWFWSATQPAAESTRSAADGVAEAAASPAPASGGEPQAQASTPPVHARGPAAWVEKLSADLQAVRTKNRRKRVFLSGYRWTSAAIIVGGPLLFVQLHNYPPEEAVTLGVAIGMVALTVLAPLGLFLWHFPRRPHVQQRRILLARALLTWLGRDLKPKSKVRLGLQPVLATQTVKQRWLHMQLSLQDGTQLRVQVDAAIRRKQGTKRSGNRTKSFDKLRIQEKLTVQLVFPQAPSPATVAKLAARLSLEAPRLVHMQADGPKLTARFVSAPGRIRTKVMFAPSTDNEDDNPLTINTSADRVGALWSADVIHTILQLASIPRPRSAPEA